MPVCHHLWVWLPGSNGPHGRPLSTSALLDPSLQPLPSTPSSSFLMPSRAAALDWSAWWGNGSLSSGLPCPQPPQQPFQLWLPLILELLQSLMSRGKGRGGFQNPEEVWKGHVQELEPTGSDPHGHMLGEYTPQLTSWPLCLQSPAGDPID